MSIENLKTFGKCFCHLPSCGLVVIPSDRLPVERLDPVGDGSSILYRLVSVARYRRHRRLRSIIINALYRGGVVGIWFAGLRLTRALDTDPFAEADEDTGETKQSQNYIHIRIQRTLSSLLPPHLPVASGRHRRETPPVCSRTAR